MAKEQLRKLTAELTAERFRSSGFKQSLDSMRKRMQARGVGLSLADKMAVRQGSHAGHGGREPLDETPAEPESAEEKASVATLQREIDHLERKLQLESTRTADLERLRTEFCRRFTQPFVANIEKELILLALGLPLTSRDSVAAPDDDR